METQYQRSWVPPIKDTNCPLVNTAQEAFNTAALTLACQYIEKIHIKMLGAKLVEFIY